jgi:rhamnulokinase
MAESYAAVAVDMGASSARFAVGRLAQGKLLVDVIEQIPHEPSQVGKHLLWDTDVLFDVCRRAVKYAAANFEEATIGVDTWGVDHGFLDSSGNLSQAPIAYRDASHAAALKELEDHQERLYALTGIQRQPFNTICQLIARRLENADLPREATWLLLPDLFSHHIGGQPGYELTQASTTQLVGIDGQWCEEAFALAGWPVPELQPEKPGRMIGKAASNVEIIRVGSHDTASAVCGLGGLADDMAFLSVGTWSLLGCLVDEPITSDAAREGNFTNERAVDGRVRFLENIPGFFVMNRLKEELRVHGTMAEWLARADQSVTDRLDLFAEDLFNPESMVGAVTGQIAYEPQTEEEWAGIALMSLADTTAEQLLKLEAVTGRQFSCIRAGGGGSASAAFCEVLANACGMPVMAGPTEATVMGNIGMQLLAKGIVKDFEELAGLLRHSTDLQVYHPRE